jgi:hypothetical protein
MSKEEILNSVKQFFDNIISYHKEHDINTHDFNKIDKINNISKKI